MRTLSAFLFCIAFSGPCPAQSNERAGRIVDAWFEWAQSGGTIQSTIVVMRDGEIVAEASIGTAVNTAMPIASLSKSLTAQCVAKLSQTGALSMDMALGRLLDVPESIQAVTVAQLITHTSGIWPDSTQDNADLQNAQTDQIRNVSQQALNRDIQMGEIGTAAYNNENYALLGVMIEEATGVTYYQACRDKVLDPLDIQSAAIQGEWAAHGAWGGWSISASDYGRFAWDMFGPASPVGKNPADWPTAELNGGANGGMGVLWREIEGRNIFWMTGMLCWNGNGDGGYFASYGGEWLVVTLYSDCLDGTESLRDLDDALFRAAVQ